MEIPTNALNLTPIQLYNAALNFNGPLQDPFIQSGIPLATNSGPLQGPFKVHVTLESGETDRFGEIAYLVEKIFKTMTHEHYAAIWRVSVHDFEDSYCCEQDDYPLFCIEPVEEEA